MSAAFTSAAGGLAAPINLDQPGGYYIHWGVVQISLANLVVIGVMIVLFVVAVLLPFPRGRDRE